jgi:hypothetical protein
MGVLLSHDADLPSATSCIAGEPIRGSWWGHEKGSLIYEVLGRVENQVAWPKLVLGKDTLVVRRLWPALVSVARCGQAWQLQALKKDCEPILEMLLSGQRVRTDQVKLPEGARKMSTIATDLEQRLLAQSESEHTESGYHARFLQSWSTWQHQQGILDNELIQVDEAIEALTSPVREFVSPERLPKALPWLRSRR